MLRVTCLQTCLNVCSHMFCPSHPRSSSQSHTLPQLSPGDGSLIPRWASKEGRCHTHRRPSEQVAVCVYTSKCVCVAVTVSGSLCGSNSVQNRGVSLCDTGYFPVHVCVYFGQVLCVAVCTHLCECEECG